MNVMYMKMLRMMITAGSLMIPSQFFAMDSFVSSLTDRVGQMAGQLADAGRALGVFRWQNGGAGDPLHINTMPLDLKKVLLGLALKHYPLAEKVRKIGQLRKVCKNWDALLHDERVLGSLVPRLFYEGGPGELLVSRPVSPAAQFALKSMVNDTFLADPRMLQPMGHLLEARSKEHLSGIVLLYGASGTGKTSLARLFAKNLKLTPKCINAAWLQGYYLDEALSGITKLFDIEQPSVIVIDEIEQLNFCTDSGARIHGFLLERLQNACENHLCIVCSDRPTEIPGHILERCSVKENVMCPSPAARRVILQLYVDALVQKYCKQPEQSAVGKWFGEAAAQIAKGLAQPHLYRQLMAAPEMTIEEGAFADDFLDAISQKLEGFTGKEIQQLISTIQMLAADDRPAGERKITRSIINMVVDGLLHNKVNSR